MIKFLPSFKISCLAVFLFLFTLSALSQAPVAGSLVIAGGGIEDGNASIYNPLIRLAGGPEKACFAVVPSASGVPFQSFTGFKEILTRYGVKPENIHLIQVALMDDDSTADMDESAWCFNGKDKEIAGLVRKCSGVWFTGGDQNRTIKTMFDENGNPTPVLEAVWDVYRSGGVIGGSSAGAAIMSEVMIGGGNSLSALQNGIIQGIQEDDFQESKGVPVTKGLGFFTPGIVDQHFEQRGRIGRLIVVLMDQREQFSLGFGVDENTAMIYSCPLETITIVGESGVTVVDVSEAEISGTDPPFEIKNVAVSLLGEGDTYNLKTGEIIPGPMKKPTVGNEYYNNENPGQGGMLSGNSTRFSDLITINLMDNKGADKVQNISFSGEHEGFLVTLRKTLESKGFYTDAPDGDDHYTVVNVRMDIAPVQISIHPFIE